MLATVGSGFGYGPLSSSASSWLMWRWEVALLLGSPSGWAMDHVSGVVDDTNGVYLARWFPVEPLIAVDLEGW